MLPSHARPVLDPYPGTPSLKAPHCPEVQTSFTRLAYNRVVGWQCPTLVTHSGTRQADARAFTQIYLHLLVRGCGPDTLTTEQRTALAYLCSVIQIITRHLQSVRARA